MPECHGDTDRQIKKGWTKLKFLYQYRPLHSCLIAESYIKNCMHFRDRGCVRTLCPLFVYATGQWCNGSHLETSGDNLSFMGKIRCEMANSVVVILSYFILFYKLIHLLLDVVVA